ncbi:MAG: hypothetical protein C0419_03835 [Microbacterium sp.]|nr:hypothetical protein [Microbacterium sp.]
MLTREPRPVGVPNAWGMESTFLRWLALQETWGVGGTPFELSDRERKAIEARLEYLGTGPMVGLMASPTGSPIPTLSPMFALWPFEWSKHERTTNPDDQPTEAEVYATIAHLMTESRRVRVDMSGGGFWMRRHESALNPAVFDRLNDPIVQACILRAAREGELDYRSDPSASRAMAGVLLHAFEEVDRPGGAASYEFALALAIGATNPKYGGLRLTDNDVFATLRHANERRAGREWPSLLSAMLGFIDWKLQRANSSVRIA